MNWQPIGTAPRDGTRILGWREHSPPYVVFWGTSPINRSAWFGGHCGIDHIDQPTHWMPLPAEPLSREQEEVRDARAKWLEEASRNVHLQAENLRLHREIQELRMAEINGWFAPPLNPNLWRWRK